MTNNYNADGSAPIRISRPGTVFLGDWPEGVPLTLELGLAIEAKRDELNRPLTLAETKEVIAEMEQ